jgi:hypothetical protein
MHSHPNFISIFWFCFRILTPPCRSSSLSRTNPACPTSRAVLSSRWGGIARLTLQPCTRNVLAADVPPSRPLWSWTIGALPCPLQQHSSFSFTTAFLLLLSAFNQPCSYNVPGTQFTVNIKFADTKPAAAPVGYPQVQTLNLLQNCSSNTPTQSLTQRRIAGCRIRYGWSVSAYKVLPPRDLCNTLAATAEPTRRICSSSRWTLRLRRTRSTCSR